MKRFLSSQEREHLKAQHRTERDKRICDRIKAVLLSDDGWDPKEIAHVLLLSDDAVNQHIHEYLELHKLKPENGGSLGKLNEEQSRKRRRMGGSEGVREKRFVPIQEDSA